MDGVIVSILITAGLTILLTLGTVYRSIRDNIDSTKKDLGEKVDAKYDAINDSIIKQAQQIGELNGKVSSINGIRQSCMARFETIERNVTILHGKKK